MRKSRDEVSPFQSRVLAECSLGSSQAQVLLGAVLLAGDRASCPSAPQSPLRHCLCASPAAAMCSSECQEGERCNEQEKGLEL